jgi:ParB family chromosome partitioning protein
MIIAGERRWRAANLAGLSEVPCIEFDIDEKTVAEIALIENLQRKDLTIWEEADGLAYLSEKFGYTHEEIAKKIGKSRTTVTESMTLASLPETIRAKCLKSNISAKSILLEIARQFDEQAMHDFVFNIKGQGLKRDEIRRSAKAGRTMTSKDLPLNKKLSNGKIYHYISSVNNFSLEIRFDSLVEYSKRDILSALKEAFESNK